MKFLAIGKKKYQLVQENAIDNNGLPPYSALQSGKLVICQYERAHDSKGTEKVYEMAASVEEMDKLFNAAEEGSLLNMTWHVVKNIPQSNEAGHRTRKTPPGKEQKHPLEPKTFKHFPHKS